MKSGTLCLIATSQGHVRIKWDEMNKATGAQRSWMYSIKGYLSWKCKVWPGQCLSSFWNGVGGGGLTDWLDWKLHSASPLPHSLEKSWGKFKGWVFLFALQWASCPTSKYYEVWSKENHVPRENHLPHSPDVRVLS